MPRQRPRRGDRRIDAAIDHFIPMGYATADIRAVIKKLLKDEVYGNDGWPFLEEDSYRVVQEALFEKQEQEEQRQLQQQEAEEAQPQQMEGAMDEAPLENNMPIVEVHNEAPAEAEPMVEEIDSILIDVPAVEAILPLPQPAVISGTRRPCYGWIVEYESESDNEEHPSSQKHKPHVPDPQSMVCKRKHPSRWDMKPLT
ncbi:hypothetical protein E2562_030356 [Oryza meyeriana var. granulata]|uniref:WIYLD domain-containing protein n=1 Tax=Oryza meyeriana var. granulata TaxID=110450 RepID=A0A6G1DPW7_9ORYZ|nr:hypothetical protein E2562_030356 [Oryza meyeriana var. granulata]